MALEKDFRAPNSPSPIYGIRPGFNVGDLDKSYLFSGISSSVAHNVYTNRATTDSSGTVASPSARVVKVIVTINSGTGSVDLSMKSNSDTYSTTIFDSGALSGVGVYELYVGGWSSPTSNNDAAFQATQYGPTAPGHTPDSENTTGDEDTTNPDPAASANWVGGTYNPVDFLSLAGDSIKFFAAVTGTISFNVDVVPVS